MLKIDKESFKISDKLYYPEITNKEQILIADSCRTENNFLQRLETNSRFSTDKKYPHFTILRNGVILQHFDTEYYSDFFMMDGISIEKIQTVSKKTGKPINKKIVAVNDLGKKMITIVLDNMNSLIYDEINNNFVNWINESCVECNVIEKEFKNIIHWEKYTKEQYNSLSNLIKYVSDKHSINLNVTCSNSIIDDEVKKFGIACVGNYIKNRIEPNPTFNFKLFEKIKFGDINNY